MTNKTTLKRLKLDPYFNKTIDTNLNVWSHDQNSYEIKFEFYDHQCDKPIDLTGADMRILLDHQGSQPKIYPLEIESKVLGLAKFIMPEQIRGCEGKFTAHIYADYPNKTHDFGSFTFYTKVSRIDGDLGGCMDEIYVSEFEKALKEIKDKSAQFGVVEKRLTERVEKIEADIQSKEIVKQDEFDSLRTRVSNVSIGGRNYLLDSGISVTTDEYVIKKINLSGNSFSEGEEFTISIKGKMGDDATHFQIYNSGGNVNLTAISKADIGVNGIYKKTFKWKKSKEDKYINIFKWPQASTSENTIEWVKLEKGNQSTDWVSAEEEKATKKDISNLQKQIDDLKKAITNLGGTL